MRMLLIALLIAIMAAGSACSQDKPLQSKQIERRDGLVFIQGGTFTNTNSNFFGKSERLSDFYIGQYEVTQQEWTEVMGHNPSAFQGDDLPVEMVSWYDAVEYCNKRSIKEGLKPYYKIDKSKKDPHNMSQHDSMKWTITVDPEADGYRLPTEAEWEYAASGGQQSKGYTYSGSSDADEAAWYWRNAGDKYLSGDWNWPIIENNRNRTKAVGLKKPNELGLYDMSGNVREWCWNWYGDSLDSSSGSYRVVKGGGWIGGLINNAVSYRGKFEANGFGPDQGFRVVRSG